jgi:hypothetical protein
VKNWFQPFAFKLSLYRYKSANNRAAAAAHQQRGLQQQQRGGGLRARDANVLVSSFKAKKMAMAAEKAFVGMGSREMKLVVSAFASGVAPGAGAWQVSHGCEKVGKLHSSLLFGVM